MTQKSKTDVDYRSKYFSLIGSLGAKGRTKKTTHEQRVEIGKKGGRPKLDPAELRFRKVTIDGVLAGYWAFQFKQKAFGTTKSQAEQRLKEKRKE